MVIRMKINSSNKNTGFTFVELIVVIVIIAILASTAIIGFRAYRESGRTRASEKIISCIDYARVTSQTSNYSTFIKFYYNNKNLMADIFTVSPSNEENIIESYKICKSEYSLMYKSTESGNYTGVGDTGLQLEFNKSTSGFQESSYVSNLIIDNDPDSELMLIKETGRAFKVDGI